MVPRMSGRWFLALLVVVHGGCLEDEDVLDATTGDAGAANLDANAGANDAAPAGDPDAAAATDDALVAPDAMITGVCELSVRPAILAFGSAEVGRRTLLPIELVNAGGAPCTIDSVRLTGDPDFGLLGSAPTTVPASGSVALWIHFDAFLAGPKTAQLAAVSGAETRNLDITGTAAFSGLRALPSAADIGSTRKNCRQTTVLGFTGEKAGGVTVESIELDAESSSAFMLERRPVPFTINESGLVGILITHRASGQRDDSARVQVRVAGVAEPFVSGIVAHSTLTLDKFTEHFPPVTGPLDVLFVVDDSTSMSRRAVAVTSAATELVRQLAAAGADLHVGATSANPAADRGTLVELDGARWLDSATPDLAVAAGRLVGLIAPARNDGKAATEAAYLAITGAAIGGPNLGFLRPEASLAIVAISDANDDSTRLSDVYSSSFFDVTAIRHDRPVTFHALVMLPSDPQGCFQGTSSLPGPKYVAVAERTGGKSASLCAADWATSLPPLVEVMNGRRAVFHIDPPGSPPSLEVYVDGARVMTGWRLDMMARGIRFDEATRPAKTSTVDIRYGSECF